MLFSSPEKIFIKNIKLKAYLVSFYDASGIYRRLVVPAVIFDVKCTCALQLIALAALRMRLVYIFFSFF